MIKKELTVKDLKLSDLIVRRYTQTLKDNPHLTVYDLFDWKKVDVSLIDYKTNKVLYDEKDLEFPSHYSQNACDIIAQKYFKRANVPNSRGKEYSMKEVTHRMVGFWVASALDEGIIDSSNMSILYDELVYMLLAQMYAPNSPQWFNTGLKYAYDINEGSDGHYYYDILEDKVVKSKDKYTRTQGSACFIISVTDALLGHKSLAEQLETEIRLFKHGSGTGTNWSNIRAEGERLTGGGKSSGLMSFLDVFDRNAKAIKSGGTTRRAAKMVTIDLDHPEIMEYIKWKSHQEDIVRDLGKMGYDTDFNGEAYDIVSGQASNNSVRFTNNFMNKIIKFKETNEDFDHTLKGRVDSAIDRVIKGSELWKEFNYSAWRCADPAPQFDDIYNEWHTCPCGEDGLYNAKHNRINATNPCSEYAFLDDTACNLASINSVKFYDAEKNVFDIQGYLHCVGLVQIVLEATIHWGQFPTEDVARKTHMFRTTGLGLANTAGLHLSMAHPYDSDESRAVASALMSIMTGHSYFVSSLMAKQVGAFPKYEINKPYMLEVIRNHARVSGARVDKYERLTYKPIKLNHRILEKVGMVTLSDTVKNVWNNTVELGEEYGFRNAQTTVIAPTGTIAFAMDCDATSTEPFYAHVIHKKLAGGGFMQMVNPKIEVALKKLGYQPTEIKDILDYILRTEKVSENGYEYERIVDGKIEDAPHLKEEHLPIFDTASQCGTGVRFILPMGHVKMMACLTPMVSGSISKTVNLPNQTTISDFENVVIDSYRLGVKAIALYRDCCKESQPLSSAIIKVGDANFEDLKYMELVKLAYNLTDELQRQPIRIRPDGILEGRKHTAIIDGLKLYIKTFFYEDGKLAEIYITSDREGTLVKGLLDSISKMISKMLQYNVPAKDVADSLRGQKYEPHGFVEGHPYITNVDSISDLVAKIIDIELGDFSSCQIKPKEYIVRTTHTIPTSKTIKVFDTDEEIQGHKVYGKTCPECNSDKMVKNGTCFICTVCGSTTGCS